MDGFERVIVTQLKVRGVPAPPSAGLFAVGSGLRQGGERDHNLSTSRGQAARDTQIIIVF
jgi:hypothetical protein